MLTLICRLALALLWTLPSSGALAQDKWLFETAFQIQTLSAGCITDRRAQDLYILGVLDPSDILSDVQENRIAGDLSTFLSGRTDLRVIKADNLGAIATSYSGFGGQSAAELSAFIEANSSADITVLFSPEAKRGADVDMEIKVWTRGGNALTCAPSFRVSIPVADEDPACAVSFAIANERRKDRLSRLEAFVSFFPQCPQAEQARSEIELITAQQREVEDAERCRREFQLALSANTARAFDAFIKVGGACPEFAAAVQLRESLKTGEACKSAFDAAVRENTESSLTGFLRQHGTCPQTASVTAQLNALRQAAAAQKPPEQPVVVAPPPQVQPQPPVFQPQPTLTCDSLWYQRNAIFDAAGYCFSTPRGQATFDNRGCTGGTPNAAGMREVNRIKALERQMGC